MYSPIRLTILNVDTVTMSANVAPSDRSPFTSQSTEKSHKRKRGLNLNLNGPAITPTSTPSKKQKGSRSPPDPSAEAAKKTKRTEEDKSASVQESQAKKESLVPQSGKTKIHRIDEGKKKPRKEKRKGDVGKAAGSTAVGDVKQKASSKAGKDEQDKATERDEFEDDEERLIRNRHSKVLSKFQKSIKHKEIEDAKAKDRDKDTEGLEETVDVEPVVAQGLEPLPQPAPAPERVEAPTYSSLPTWISEPVYVPSERKARFSELGIEHKLLDILEHNGYKEAFAVQSAVIPLLLKGLQTHPGDICVSAATGSGKTLSYVLPLVTALEHIPIPRLRGLIVVPTRELVKQARETCELCATGSGLKIASAAGNVAIKDEQSQLMRTDHVYDPQSSNMRARRRLTGDDWTNFNIGELIDMAEAANETLPGYIGRPEPNVDILICTPGRLVDHIRYTKGFSLRTIEWLIIDEADRLLNESFQEWVEVMMTSLDARKTPGTFGYSGQVLSNLRLSIGTSDPRKVILSATMTRDITKLNSLQLLNPKLVVIGSEDARDADGEDGMHDDSQYTLPHTLKEVSVPVGDGSSKPLYLLELLLSHIQVEVGTLRDAGNAPDAHESEVSSALSSSDDSGSPSASSGEESSDTSSSSADSDSESESESGESAHSEDMTVESIRNGPREGGNTVLIFTKSSESASRLSRLLALLRPSLANRVGTVIKSSNSSASRKTLSAYRRGNIPIIVATDRASRGLDLPSLKHVVNYDVPASITAYVHRVGRTARAGKEGTAWTLVARREGRWFAKEIAKSTDGKISRSGNVGKVNVKLDDLGSLQSKYEAKLDELEWEVRMDETPKSGKPRS